MDITMPPHRTVVRHLVYNKTFSICLALLYLKRVFFFVLFKKTLCLIDWWLLYNIGLISATYQHELAIDVHMSPPSWTSLPPPILSHPSRLLWNPGLSSPSHRANFHWPSALHMIVYMLPCYSLQSSQPLLPPSAFVHKSVLCVCISTAALQTGSSIPSF